MRRIINIIILSTILFVSLNSCKEDTPSPTTNIPDTTNTVKVDESLEVFLSGDYSYSYKPTNTTFNTYDARVTSGSLVISTNSLLQNGAAYNQIIRVLNFNNSVGTFNDCWVSVTIGASKDLTGGNYMGAKGTAKVTISKYDSQVVQGTFEFESSETSRSQMLYGQSGKFKMQNKTK